MRIGADKILDGRVKTTSSPFSAPSGGGTPDPMSDLIYLVVIVGFFALAFGLLRACERIIGPETPTVASTATPAAEPAEATA